jgi:hypothetical protein
VKVQRITSSNVYVTKDLNIKIKPPYMMNLFKKNLDIGSKNGEKYNFFSPEELKDGKISDVKTYEQILAYNCGYLLFQLITDNIPL